MAFANKLRDLREAKNLTQEELANMCDVSLKLYPATKLDNLNLDIEKLMTHLLKL